MTAYGYGVNKYTQGRTAVNNVPSVDRITHSDAVNSEVEGRVFVDARDNTEYGIARTYFRMQWVRSSGSDDNSGSQPRRGQWFGAGTSSLTTGGAFSNLQTGFQASSAFVQLGGFTAGRLESYAGPNLSLNQTTLVQPSNGRVNMFAYTASLGSGMTITGAVEDAAELRSGIAGAINANQAAYNGGAYADANAANTGSPTVSNVPDLVASFDVSQAWGTAKIAGVWHHVSTNPTDNVASKEGYAVIGHTKINLPMIAAGDNIQFLAAYGLGTTGRTVGANASDTGNGANSSWGLGNAQWGQYDGVVYNATTGGAYAVGGANRLSLSTSYVLGAQFQHYFSPTVSAYLSGSYGVINYSTGARAAVVNGNSGSNQRNPRNGDMYGVEMGLIWSPITGLEISPSVAYKKAEMDKAPFGATPNTACPTNGYKVNKCSDDMYTARIRVSRSF